MDHPTRHDVEKQRGRGTAGMSELNVRGQGHPPADILGMARLEQRGNYLNHAAVNSQGGANHVDVGRGGGALPLGEAAACRRVGRVVVEGVRGGIPMGRAAGVQGRRP